MVVRLFFRRASKESRLKRDIPIVIGTMISNNKIMIELDRIPTNRDIDRILYILNTEEWELVSPSKSFFNVKQIIKESRVRAKELRRKRV